MSNIFSRILVGIDDSAAAQAALAFGVRLTREHEGELFLAHSVNWMPIVAETVATGAIVDTTPIVEELKADGQDQLDRAVAEAKRHGIDARTYACEGEPATRILEAAADAKCSLIVIGTHGRNGLNRLLLGSTAEAVLRGSTLPVLMVHADSKQADAGRRCFERIAVGLDGSDPSQAALQIVLDLAVADHCAVDFYSVARPDVDARQQAVRVIGRAVAAANAHGVAAKGHVVGGCSRMPISSCSAAMAGRGSSDFLSAALPSMSYAIRRSPC
jgi:nucleotide-binding universal stress UspA family protein